MHFLSRAYVEAALLRLNGIKVGGTHLSVTVAKYLLVRGSSSRKFDLGVLVPKHSEAFSESQKDICKVVRSPPSCFSWCDIVAGLSCTVRYRVLLPKEDWFFACLGRGSEEDNKVLVAFLFSEVKYVRRSLEVQRFGSEVFRAPYVALFP